MVTLAEADRLQQRRTTPDATPVAKQRETKLQFSQTLQNGPKIGKLLHGPIGLSFSCNTQMIGLEFSINIKKALIHPALYQWFWVLVVLW